MKHYITVFEGNDKIQTYLLNILPSFSSGRITIGRLPTNDIVLPYQSVSRSHAVIELRGDVLDMVDTGSLNKLRVNGIAYERIRLTNGVSVAIGTSVNIISLQYTAVAESDAPKVKPINSVDDNTVIFNMNGQQNATSASVPSKPESDKAEDDGWAPMPRGTSHKATPVAPLGQNHPSANTPSPSQSQSEPQTPDSDPKQTPTKTASPSKAYMGRRFIAFMADMVICTFMIIGAAVLMLMLLNNVFGIKVIALLSFLVAISVSWIYSTLGESGESGATLGKMAVGLKVVDCKTGSTVSVKTASIRFFSKFLSMFILFAGFLPIFGKKQTFHDYLSKTKIIKNN